MLYPLPGLIQTAFANVISNVSTNSATYVDLVPLSITLSTGPNFVEVDFNACVEAVSATPDISFQMMVDGVVVKATKGRIGASGNPGYTSCPSIRYRSTLRVTEGSHTIKMQWKTSTGTAQIRPATFIYASGSLLIREVSL